MLRISSVMFSNHEIRYNAAEVIIKPGYIVPAKFIFQILNSFFFSEKESVSKFIST